MARKKKKKNKNLWFEPGELPTWVEEEKDLETRLERYGKFKKTIALDIENIFKSGDEELLLRSLKPHITKKAYYYAGKWNYYRLYEADFESAFWDESWKVICGYEWRGGSGKYLLYETLILAWDREAEDVTRSATKTDKRRALHTARPLSEYFEEVTPDTRINLEEQVVYELALSQFIEEHLNPKEERLLKLLMEDPKASLRDLETIVGYSKDTVKRTLERIGQKMIGEGILEV